MGGKSGGQPTMKVTRYYASMHTGFCQGPVDAVKALWVGEKKAWSGSITENSIEFIVKENMFGGPKKEGGLLGYVEVYLGGPDQVLSDISASRLGGESGAEVPGYRGICSGFFRGGGQDQGRVDRLKNNVFGKLLLPVFAAFWGNGFYWGTQPYLKPVWVTVQRIPARGLSPNTAPIPRGVIYNPMSLYFELDDSGSMGGTRMTNLKASMNLVLDQLAGQIEAGQRVDLGMVGFNRGRIEKQRIGLSDIQDFRDFIAGLTASGGTPFDTPMQHAVNWFEASRNDGQLVNRFNFFVTDGAPSSSSHIAAADIASELLDRTIPVDMWGININLAGTQYTEYLHNMEAPVPVISGNNPDELATIIANAMISIFDANPAHIIYECLTDTDWGMGADPASIDTESFQSASARLFGENFGLFMQWTAQSSIEDFINNVLEHAKGALYPHPRTGKMTLRLLRDDLVPANLKEITPDNATLTNFSRKGWGETVNEVVVTWTNPETEKEETVRAQDLANIAQQGGIVSDSKNYHGIRTAEVAARVAERELREASAPLCSCEVEVNREFWDIVPFDGVRVTWPEYGLNELVMRVMKVNYGDSSSSKIRLSLVEDVFSLPLASYVPPATGEWQDPAVPPAPVTQAFLMPPPAFIASNEGIDLGTLTYPTTGAAPMALNPTTSESAHYEVLAQTSTPSGDTVWAGTGAEREFLGRGELANALPAEPTSAGVTLENSAGLVPVRDELLIIGDDATPLEARELALVTLIDEEDGTPTLLRGALDTVPQAWPAGTQVLVTSLSMWRPLPRELSDGQSVTLKFLTSTPGGMLEEYEAPEFTGTAMARPSLPTRPANVKINGVGIDEVDGVLLGGELTFTWAHRNRLLEDAAMYAWDAASLPLENGVSYRVELDALAGDRSLIEAAWYSENVGGVDTHTVDLAVDEPPAGTTYMIGRVVAERDGQDAWQSAELWITPLLPPQIIAIEPFSLYPPEIIDVQPIED